MLSERLSLKVNKDEVVDKFWLGEGRLCDKLCATSMRREEEQEQERTK